MFLEIATVDKRFVKKLSCFHSFHNSGCVLCCK